LLGLDIFVASISLITVFFVSIGITSLSMGLGAYFPTFNVENPMQLTTGVGAVLTVILSMLYIAATIMIVAFPMNEYFYVGANFHAISKLTLIYTTVWLVGITTLATIFPIKLGLKKLYQRSK
jgi:hypothetical protein